MSRQGTAASPGMVVPPAHTPGHAGRRVTSKEGSPTVICRLWLPVLLCVLVLSAVAQADRDAVPSPRAQSAFRALKAGNPARALRDSALAVAERPHSAGTWSVRGYVLSQSGDKQGAAAAYRRAVDLDPSDPIARNNLGTVLLAMGNARDALAAFTRAVALSPFYADARNNRGAALEKLGRRREAASAYRVTTVIAPRHAQAHNNLGAVQLHSGNVRAAAASFARAAALDPQFDAPALNLAMLDEGGGSDASLRRLQQAAARPGASAALRARALAAQAGREADARRWRRALPLYQRALRLTPNDAALLNNVAVVEDQLGMDREALMHLGAALELAPEMKVAQNNMGIVHVHRNRLDLAQSVFEDLIDQDPNFHRAHYNLGVIHASRGRVRDARAAFRRAARLAPRDADVRYNLALLARREGGDPVSEMRAYQDVLRLDANLAEAHFALGALLADPETPASVRDPALARRHLRRFLQLAPPADREGRAQAEEWLAYLDYRR